MSNKPVTDSLKTLLADSYILYLKTQNYHWNVTGMHFASLHALFEEQYTDLFEAIDDIAEHIRTLGEKAPGSFKSYNALKTIEDADGDENADATTMIRHLRDDQYKILQTLEHLLQKAQDAEDEPSVDLAVERMRVHKKNSWMLNALLEE